MAAERMLGVSTGYGGSRERGAGSGGGNRKGAPPVLRERPLTGPYASGAATAAG
jgi:hypothetical protein